MKINNLNEIPSSERIGVIINVNTKYVSTLALLSALKYLKVPIVLIDCDSKDGSYEHFEKLNQSFSFYLTRLPLKKHGYTLDFIFRNINSKFLYLIDSDVEFINDDIAKFIERYIEKENVFGAGFEHSAGWLSDKSFMGFKFGYFAERMWIPFTCLKVDSIKEALKAGKSFININIFNDFAPFQIIAKALMLRFKIPIFNNSRLEILNLFKKQYFGLKPSFIVYDTGAKIHEFLKYQKGYNYVGIPARFHEDSVLHYHGITRRVLNPNDDNSAIIDDYSMIIDKIKNRYRVNLDML